MQRTKFDRISLPSSPIRSLRSHEVYDYGATERNPSNRWTPRQRTALMLLKNCYNNDWKDISLIFNKLFLEELPRKEKLTEQALKSQWYDIGKGRQDGTITSAMPRWPYPTAMTATHLVIQNLLEKTAKTLGVALVRKKPSLPLISPCARMNKRKREVYEPDENRLSVDSARTDFLTDGDEDNSGLTSRPTARRLFTTPKKTVHHDHNYGLMSPPNSKKAKQYHPQSDIPQFSAPTTLPIRASPKPPKADILPSSLPNGTQLAYKPTPYTGPKPLPLLGFRAFGPLSQGTNSSAGFRAAAFIGHHELPSPPSPDDHDLRASIIHHVLRRKSVKSQSEWKSPVVSFTKNPMRALHIALQLGMHHLAAIDLRRADEQGNVMSARRLQLNLRGHKPSGEYLVYGGVEPNAILSVVPFPRFLDQICSITVPEDEDPFKIRILRKHRLLFSARREIERDPLPMTFRLGRAIGELLRCALLLPEYALVDAVSSIVWDYKWCRGRRDKHWTCNVAFTSGVKHGYQDKQPLPLIALDPEKAIKEEPNPTEEYSLLENDVFQINPPNNRNLSEDYTFFDDFMTEIEAAVGTKDQEIAEMDSEDHYIAREAMRPSYLPTEGHVSEDENAEDEAAGCEFFQPSRSLCGLEPQKNADGVAVDDDYVDNIYSYSWTGM